MADTRFVAAMSASSPRSILSGIRADFTLRTSTRTARTAVGHRAIGPIRATWTRTGITRSCPYGSRPSTSALSVLDRTRAAELLWETRIDEPRAAPLAEIGQDAHEVAALDERAPVVTTHARRYAAAHPISSLTSSSAVSHILGGP